MKQEAQLFFSYNIYCNNNRGCANATMQTTIILYRLDSEEYKDDLFMYTESPGSEFHNDIE